MFIEGNFTSLNKYISAERSNRYMASKIKKDMTSLVYWQTMNQPKIKTPCKLKMIWHVKDKRTDGDNVAFAKKFVLDGLVKAKVIPDDTMKHITGFIDEFKVSDKVGVEVLKVG